MAALTLHENGWLSVPWTEFIGRDGSHGASFSSGWDNGGNQATFNILISWDDGLQAEQDILGTAFFNGTSLERQPPVRHPYKPWMRAERILSAHPMRFDAKTGAVMPAFGQGNSLLGGVMGTYDLWMLSIGFITPTYRIVDDTTLNSQFGGHEWNRYCIVEQKQEFATITRETGTWLWADGSAGPGRDGFKIGEQVSFNAPWPETTASWRIKVTWKRVPRVGLFGDYGTSDFLNQNLATTGGFLHNGATNLWNAPGNDFTGVLRFINPDTTPLPSPFSPSSQGLAITDPNLYYDVQLEFHWFDPLPGNDHYHGHNLAPSPKRNDPFWYLITDAGFDETTGDPKGYGIYPTTDLTKIFQLSYT